MPQIPGSPTSVNHKEDRAKLLNKQLRIVDDCSLPDNSYIFRIAYGRGMGPTLLRQTLLETGMTEFDNRIHHESQWNLWWKGYRFKNEELAYLSDYQRVNHHPAPLGRQADIIKKDGLLRAVRRMCAAYPKCANLLLYPMSYHLPREEAQFVNMFCQNARAIKKNLGNPKAHNRLNTDEETTSDSYCNSTLSSTQTQTECSNIWILKPADQSRGRGIYLFNKLEDLVYVSKSVVQRYITDPLLIYGHKFDLRLYAVVPSYAPFIVYICPDGIVRFATEPFDLSNLKNVYSHLTNSSININGPGYLLNKTGIGCGCKWTIRQFRLWMRENNLNDRLLWTRIHILIVLTLLSQASSIPKIPNAYEVFGFDILVDSKLRPWLIEVNANPSLSTDCPVDETVKKPLLMSVLEMIGLYPPRSSDCIPELVYVVGRDSPGVALSKPCTLPPIASKRNTQFKVCIEKSKKKTVNRLQTSEQNSVENRAHPSPIGKHATQGNRNNNPSLISNLTLTIDESSQSSRSKSFHLHPQTISRFKSILNTRTRLDESLMDSCPLYGTGSEQLLPKLLALGKRFPGLLNVEGQTCQPSTTSGKIHPQLDRSRPSDPGIPLTVKPSGEHLTTKSISEKPEHLVPLNVPLNVTEQKVGRYLIPHAFGQLKLAFPFNLITRIACARERNGYPDGKMIVRASSRLVNFMSQEYKKTNFTAIDWTLMDIPEIWGAKV